VGTGNVPPDPPFVRRGLKVNFYNFSYKARLEYDLTPKNMLYAMYSTGFRPGDVGIQPITGQPNILGAEQLISIELGAKNRFLDDSLQVNVGVFYYDYRNDGFRLFYIPDTAHPLDPSVPGNFVNVNIPLHNVGGELELLYRLTPNDRIGLNANYVESRWYDQPAGFKAAQPEKKRALTPYTITANYSHEFLLPGGSTVSARIDGRYEAAHPASNLHVDWLKIGYDRYVYLGARTIGNLSAGWASEGGRYSINAYVRNFTDKQYAIYGVQGTNLNQLTLTWSDPRTYGAQASVRF
jgi:iron complex outermembrane receptor protein